MKQYTLKDGRVAYCYLEKGVESNVVVTLIETATPDVYASLRHSYTGGDKGVTEFDAVTIEDVEIATEKAEIISGVDEVIS
jgi:hypothetical protein